MQKTGPLARVQREVTGRRLLWNLFFYGSHIALFSYGWWKQASDSRLALLNTLKWSVWNSRGAGLCLGYDGAMLLLPVCRNIVTFLRPTFRNILPLDESVWFHRQYAYAMLFFTFIHTTAHYVNMILVESVQARKGDDTAAGIMYTEVGGFTGHVMLVIMFFMYTTAHYKIRQQCFEAFWYTHHLAFFFFIGLYTHATGCFVRGALPGEPVQCLGYGTVWITMWGGILYFMERLYREYRVRRETKIVGVLMHPSGAMEIRFQKPSFKYKSGQWLFMNVPEVSRWQYHPFTISSSPHDPYISVHIRQAGDWTRALGERLGCTQALAAQLTQDAKLGQEKGEAGYGEAAFVDVTRLDQTSLPMMRIDGPYGAPAEDVFEKEVAILIGTGIGVTPWASVLKNIIHMQKKRKLGALRRVVFVWLNRDASSFEWFATLLRQLEDQLEDDGLISINTYLTSRMTEEQINNIVLNDDGETDAITNLKSRTNFGRPDWSHMFAQMRNGIETGTWLKGRESSLSTKVGVYYCGPSPLAKVLKQKCKEATSSQVAFQFFAEHF